MKGHISTINGTGRGASHRGFTGTHRDSIGIYRV